MLRPRAVIRHPPVRSSSHERDVALGSFPAPARFGFSESASAERRETTGLARHFPSAALAPRQRGRRSLRARRVNASLRRTPSSHSPATPGCERDTMKAPPTAAIPWSATRPIPIPPDVRNEGARREVPALNRRAIRVARPIPGGRPAQRWKDNQFRGRRTDRAVGDAIAVQRYHSSHERSIADPRNHAFECVTRPSQARLNAYAISVVVGCAWSIQIAVVGVALGHNRRVFHQPPTQPPITSVISTRRRSTTRSHCRAPCSRSLRAVLRTLTSASWSDTAPRHSARQDGLRPKDVYVEKPCMLEITHAVELIAPRGNARL